MNPDYFLLLAIDPLEYDCETFEQELAPRSWQGGRRCPGGLPGTTAAGGGGAAPLEPY